MADEWSSAATAQIHNADANKFVPGQGIVWDNTYAGIATSECFTRAQRAAAALLYRFLAETNRLM